MANEIYQHTHQGLSRLVSARAATRLLEQALKRQRTSADEVSAEKMGELLVGPVYRELRGALPRAGLKRHLKWLAARLRAVKPVEEERLREIVTFDPSSPPPAPARSEAADVEMGVESSNGQAVAPIAFVEEEAESAPPVKLPSETLHHIALQFAQLEHVKLVAAVRQSGEVVVSRGTAPHLEALYRYGPTALRLLRRTGRVRSYYLVHTEGQLFLLPFQDDTLILIGTTELNLGAVFTTLMKVEEEL